VLKSRKYYSGKRYYCCFMELIVIASIALHKGAPAFGDLRELVTAQNGFAIGLAYL
jgi:hypothetical protein